MDGMDSRQTRDLIPGRAWPADMIINKFVLSAGPYMAIEIAVSWSMMPPETKRGEIDESALTKTRAK